MEYSAFFYINGYSFYLFTHLIIGSIGSSSAIEVANTVYKDKIVLLESVERNLLKISFTDKDEFSKFCGLSLIGVKDGSPIKEGAEVLKMAIVNHLHEKIMQDK